MCLYIAFSSLDCLYNEAIVENVAINGLCRHLFVGITILIFSTAKLFHSHQQEIRVPAYSSTIFPQMKSRLPHAVLRLDVSSVLNATPVLLQTDFARRYRISSCLYTLDYRLVLFYLEGHTLNVCILEGRNMECLERKKPPAQPGWWAQSTVCGPHRGDKFHSQIFTLHLLLFVFCSDWDEADFSCSSDLQVDAVSLITRGIEHLLSSYYL